MMTRVHQAKTEVRDGIVCTIVRKRDQRVTATVEDQKDTFTEWEDAELWVDRILRAKKGLRIS